MSKELFKYEYSTIELRPLGTTGYYTNDMGDLFEVDRLTGEAKSKEMEKR